VIKMLTADPPIAFKRIIDKKTGKPRLAVTRENIVDEVSSTSLPSARVSASHPPAVVASDEKLSPDSIAPLSEWTDSCLQPVRRLYSDATRDPVDEKHGSTTTRAPRELDTDGWTDGAFSPARRRFADKKRSNSIQPRSSSSVRSSSTASTRFRSGFEGTREANTRCPSSSASVSEHGPPLAPLR
jgi:hypothetical protein